MKRTRHELRKALRLVRRLDQLRHLPVHPRVVQLLEGLAPQMRARHLADEEDERRRVLRGRVDADGSVRRTGRARDEADAGLARQLPVPLRHVRRARLVAGDDEPDRCVAERVEDGDVALARDAERRVDAVHNQLVDEDLRTGAGQGTMIGCSRKIVARWVFGFSSSAGST